LPSAATPCCGTWTRCPRTKPSPTTSATSAPSTPESTQRAADLINRYPDRFLFGSDVVAPTSIDAQVAVFDAYAPLWALLTPEARTKVRKGNYERLFDAARVNVRAWEKAHANDPQVVPPWTPVSGTGKERESR
jgi:hypothetical protein